MTRMGRQIKFHTHSFKVSKEMGEEIEAFCLKHCIDSRSEFYRFAITQAIKPDVEDPELVFSSLKQLHDKMHIIERQQEILFGFIGFIAQYYLAYHSEIPEELKQASSVSAIHRYEKMFKAYQESLKSSPSMFESLLADYFEDK